MAIEERTSSAQAWTAFWSEQGDGSRCLAGVHPDVDRALSDHWSAFAGALVPGSRVLDLGCGAGVVGRALLAAQGQLQITGIDLATIPPVTDKRVELLSGTRMESLPFADASFDAAVSQFGFEYGRVDEAAKELARVLAPGGRFSLLVHHSESSILNHNRARNRALRALAGEGIGTAFLSGSASGLDQQIASLMRQFPHEVIAMQAAQALRSRIGRGETERAAIWEAVQNAFLPERQILDELEACCVAPGELDGWLARLGRMLEIRTPSTLGKGTGEAIAWKIEGVRRPGSDATQ